MSYCLERILTKSSKIYHTGNGPLAGTEEKFPGPDNPSKMRRSVENAEHVGQLQRACSSCCELTTWLQGYSHLEPVKTFGMSNDDVGHNTIVVLGLRRLRIRTKHIITTIGTSQMLFVPSIPTVDPQVPATQLTERLHSSWVEQNRLAYIRLAREDRMMSKDFAVGLRTSVAFLNAARRIPASAFSITSRFVLTPEIWPVGVIEQKGKNLSCIRDRIGGLNVFERVLHKSVQLSMM